MFKKFGKLVVPFMLTSFSPFLVNSSAHASTYWTDWHKCTFSVIHNAYTPWRARIVVRSDGAARPEQVEFGNGNDEEIFYLLASDNWVAAGQRRFSSDYFEATNGVVGTTSKDFYTATWISAKLPRYARIVLQKSGTGEICTSDIKI